MMREIIAPVGDTALIKRMSPSAIMPTRGTPRSIGLDCYADMPGLIDNQGEVALLSGHRRLVGLGFAVTPPIGCYARIAERSGLASKHGIMILGGVIDEDYRGEIKAILYNSGDHAFFLSHGLRVCQLIFEQARIPLIKAVDELPGTARGTAGFGSTGA